LIILILFGKEYKLWSSSLFSFLQSQVISSLFSPDILLSTLFSNTLSRCSSLNVTDQVSHPYRTTGKITFLYILIFMFLDSRREDKRFCPKYTYSIYMHFRLPSMHTTCPAYFIHLHLVILAIFCMDNNWWRFPLRNFLHPSVTSSLIATHILCDCK
jgi:hypothetical protein